MTNKQEGHQPCQTGAPEIANLAEENDLNVNDSERVVGLDPMHYSPLELVHYRPPIGPWGWTSLADHLKLAPTLFDLRHPGVAPPYPAHPWDEGAELEAIALGLLSFCGVDAAAAWQDDDGFHFLAPGEEPQDEDLQDHVLGRRTWWSSLGSLDGTTRVVAIEMELINDGLWLPPALRVPVPVHPRSDWFDPDHPSRDLVVHQMVDTALNLGEAAVALFGEGQVPLFVAYHGTPGLTLYWPTDDIPVAEAHALAQAIIEWDRPRFREEPGGFRPLAGRYWKADAGLPYNLVVRPVTATPDQLQRLPLGVNLETGLRSFLVSLMASSHGFEGFPRDLRPALTSLTLDYGVDF